MKQKSDIKKFIETVLDSSVPADQQSKICFFWIYRRKNR